MQRVALEEAMTGGELMECDAIVQRYSLYVLLNAVFAKAEREGLRVNLTLTRPRKKRAKKAK